MKKIGKVFVSIFFFVLFSGNIYAKDIVQIRVESPTITMNDFLYVEIIVNASRKDIDKIDYQKTIENHFKLIDKETRQFDGAINIIINGKKMTQGEAQYIITLALLPENPGIFELGPVSAIVNGKEHLSNSLKVKVMERSAKKTEEIFIRIELNEDKETYYVGEPIILNILLYKTISVSGLKPIENPEYKTFWEVPLTIKVPDIIEHKYIGEAFYTRNSIYRKLIIPSEKGTKVINGGEYFAVTRMGQKRIKCPPKKVEIIPLPQENKPDNFNGLVGDFSLETSVDQEVMTIEDTVNFYVKLKNVISNPETTIEFDFSNFDDFKIFKGEIVDEQIHFRNGYVVFDRTYKYPLKPKIDGEVFVPMLKFSYFNPYKEQYQTIATDPIKLQVKLIENQDSIVDKGDGGKETLEQQNIGISYIYEDLSAKSSVYLYEKPYRNYILAGLSFFPLLFIASVAFFTLRKRQIRNADSIKQSKALKNFISTVKKNQNRLNKGELKEYFDILEKAVSDYFSDKLILKKSSIMKNEIAKILSDNGIPDEEIAELKNVYDAIGNVLYSPAGKSIADANDFSKKVITLLKNIDKHNLKAQ